MLGQVVRSVSEIIPQITLVVIILIVKRMKIVIAKNDRAKLLHVQLKSIVEPTNLAITVLQIKFSLRHFLIS
jgi:hypothetical protein